MANVATSMTLEEIATSLERTLATGDDELRAAAIRESAVLLQIGEAILERWIEAQGEVPTDKLREGFRLLALQRQGAKRDPSFNACRETCRELVYHHNLLQHEPEHPKTAQRIRLAAMVARHLALFVGGKLEVAGLGEFCCSSRPLHAQDAVAPSGASTS